MMVEIGRPRDPRIDAAVLDATRELLGETDYASLSVDAIAKRAGTSKPAIYRRWPSKAHLVHEAVFPITEYTELPETGELLSDVSEMMRRSAGILTTPRRWPRCRTWSGNWPPTPRCTPRSSSDSFTSCPTVLRWLDVARKRGEVRPEVTSADIVDALAGITFLALITHPDTLDEKWVERTAEFITRGISA